MTTPDKMIKKQKFAHHYSLTGDPFEAAIYAGHTGTAASIRTQGGRLKRDKEVQELIQKEHDKRIALYSKPLEDAGMNAVETIERITHVARMGKTEAIRLKALELMARSRALLTDKFSVDTKLRDEYKQITTKRFNENDEEVELKIKKSTSDNGI
jgi:phage terminase small subunit